MYRHIFKLFLGFLFCAQLLCAQQDIHERRKNLKTAQDAFERLDYLRAFNLYEEVMKYDSLNPYITFRSGICLFSLSKTDTTCLKYFRKTKIKIPESHYYMGIVYLHEGQTKNALEELNQFKTLNIKEAAITNTEVAKWIKTCESALSEETKMQTLVVKNLGNSINTSFPEYVPLIWNINGSLVFTSRRSDSKGGLKDPYGKFYEDVYVAQKSGAGWSAPSSIGDNINTTSHDACVAFSPSGNELLIYRTDKKQTGGDLYSSLYDGVKWSAPKKLGPEINSEDLEASACFSSSGNEIIFSSNRPGGFGGKDLYITRKFMNGKYSIPRNLGPEINTEQEEDAPFIDKNTNALYFSSKGHNSVGEYDIFMSEYNTDLDNWSKTENLGMPINSTSDDIYYVRTDGENTALFTSRREGGFGEADLYEVNYNESTLATISCKFNTEKDKSNIKDLHVTLYDLESGKLEGIYRPNKEYTNMILVVTVNKAYKMVVEANGLEPITSKTVFNGTNNELQIDLDKKTTN